MCVCCTYFCTCSYIFFARRLCLGSCYYGVQFVLHIMTAICFLCICRLQVNSRCAVKQKDTFALMISCAASFCPFRFVANHVCMLRCCASGFGFWSQSNTTDMFCLHILAPAKVALCSLWSGLYPCESTLWFPLCFAIQWPSQALSSLNTCNYSHYPQSPPALPLCLSLSASPAVYLSAHIFLWLTHRKQKRKEKNDKRCVIDDQETEKQPN